MNIVSFLKENNLHIFLAKVYFKMYSLGLISFNDIQYNGNIKDDISIIKCPDRRNPEIPKIVWMYWDGCDKEVSFFSSDIKSKNPTWDVRVLNRSSLKNYLPKFNFTSLNMPLANITDLIRLELLFEYGGVWIDYTTVLTQPLEFFINIENKEKYDVIAYYRKVSTIDLNSPAMESWFLAAPKKSQFIKECLIEFDDVKKIGSKLFFRKMSNRNDFHIIKQNISPLEYLIVYLVFQIVMRYKDVNLYLRISDDSAFLIQDTLGWRAHKSSIIFFIKDMPEKKSPIYKLTSGDRQYMSIIKKSFLNKKSILGSIMGDSEKDL